jgi:hypothetical protein
MAILDPKETVLRLLDPQPQDGTGPGFISALDMKTVCGNLYDQIARVNYDISGLPDRELLQNVLRDQENFKLNRDRLLAPLITDSGRIKPDLSTEDLARVLARFILDNADIQAVAPDVTINDSSTNFDATKAVMVNEKYRGNTPYQWGNSVFTLVDSQNRQQMYWWDGTTFIQVTSAPTTEPDPLNVTPGDTFRAQNLHELTPESLFSLGMRGRDNAWPTTWTELPAEHFFSLSSGRYSIELFWVPGPGVGVDGHFVTGRQLSE